MLKHLALSSYATEHDINGVADPFLQVRLLQLLRCGGGKFRPSGGNEGWENSGLVGDLRDTHVGLECHKSIRRMEIKPTFKY